MKTKTKVRVTRKPRKNPYGMVDFSFGDIQYQIDPARRKVYRAWVEVETSKSALIMGVFSTSATAAAK